MNYSEVKELLDAGFKAEEIREMLNPQNPQVNPQSEQKPEKGMWILREMFNNSQPEQKPESEHFPEEPKKGSENVQNQDRDPGDAGPDSAAKKEENTNDPRFDQLNSTMERLIKTIQLSNLQTSRTETQSAVDINKQVDSIMASIIRPEHKEKEEK